MALLNLWSWQPSECVSLRWLITPADARASPQLLQLFRWRSWFFVTLDSQILCSLSVGDPFPPGLFVLRHPTAQLSPFPNPGTSQATPELKPIRSCFLPSSLRQTSPKHQHCSCLPLLVFVIRNFRLSHDIQGDPAPRSYPLMVDMSKILERVLAQLHG